MRSRRVPEGEPLPASSGARSPSPLFVGRGDLVAALEDGLDDALAARGRTFLIAGEPGIGKTRAVEDLLRRAAQRGFSTHVSRCHDVQGVPALWPWARLVNEITSGGRPSELLKRLGLRERRALARLHPESDTGDAESFAVDGKQAQFELFDAIVKLVRHAARRTPFLVVLEDVHWADPASLHLARFLGREIHADRVVLVATYRDTEVSAGAPLEKDLADLAANARLIELAGLDETAIARVMAYVAGFEVSGVLAAAVFAQTGGNPFFATEVVRMLAQERRLGSPDGPTPAAVPLPPSVRAVLQRRLGKLSPESAALLAQAAVLGAEINLPVFERAASQFSRAALLRALDEARAARLVEPIPDDSARLRFAHDLIRETIYEGLGMTERSRLHADAADGVRAAYALHLDDHWGEIARHLLLAGTPDSVRDAADYARRAGDVAARRGSFDEAARQYEQALDALARNEQGRAGETLERVGLRGDLFLALGDVLWPVGDRKVARRHYRAAADLARTFDNPTLLARAAIAMSDRTDLALDVPEDAIALLEEALAALPSGDDPLRVRMLSHLARASYHGAERVGLIALAREAVAMAERLDDPVALFGALSSLHYGLMVPGTVDERRTIGERLLALARASGSAHLEATARLWRIVDALEIPDVGLCDRELARFTALADETRQPFYRWLATAFQGTRAMMAGRLTEADALIHRAVEIGEEAGSPNALAVFGTQLFHLREEQGRVAEMEPLMRQVVDANPALPVFRIGIPLIYALCGRHEEASASFAEVAARDFADVPHDVHRLPMMSSAAFVAAFLGDERRARMLLEELLASEGAVMVAGIATYWGGPIDRILGLLERALGRFDDAVHHHKSAIELATRAAAPLCRAHSEIELAETLIQRGRPEDTARSRKLIVAASATYRRLGVDWRLEGVAHLVAALGAPGTPVGTPLGRQMSGSGRFVKLTGVWQIEFDGRTVELPDLKGLHDLAHLLRSPGREVHVNDLISTVSGERVRTPVRSDYLTVRRAVDIPNPPLDGRASAAYRTRLAELREELTEAEESSDLGRTTVLNQEIAALEAALAAAYGLGGRTRRAGDAVERSRKAVYNRIRSAIERIAAQHPDLGHHLQHATRTGLYCTYSPERAMEWTIG